MVQLEFPNICKVSCSKCGNLDFNFIKSDKQIEFVDIYYCEKCNFIMKISLYSSVTEV